MSSSLGEPLPRDLLDEGERLAPEELRELQLVRLRATLRHAYDHVELYRRKFDAAGVGPEDCRSLDDLARFPFTTKADLRDTYPFGMFAVPMEEVRRVHASSGTTGRATVVGYTEGDISRWADVVARSIRAAGGRRGHKVHVSYGYGLFTGGLGAHYGAERAGCTVIPASGGMTARQVQLIRDFRPEIIMVTPSYMLTLLDEFEKQGVDPRTSSLEVGIFGAEPWTQEMRREIEERAGLHAVDIYGLSEVMGPGVAQECVETKDGLHIWDEKCAWARRSAGGHDSAPGPGTRGAATLHYRLAAGQGGPSHEGQHDPRASSGDPPPRGGRDGGSLAAHPRHAQAGAHGAAYLRRRPSEAAREESGQGCACR
ncbi:AMP-binding protein [Streptomyces scabiei]|nr:AMP-binding protein [Streptomyces scabiei]MDX3288145.1 AMP-binding protein [Streptomyces scabiei]